MADLILVQEIRQVSGGFIVEARWPMGNKPGGYGEVICPKFDDVIALLKSCAIFDSPESEAPDGRGV
jgi:hypothetical protein